MFNLIGRRLNSAGTILLLASPIVLGGYIYEKLNPSESQPQQSAIEERVYHQTREDLEKRHCLDGTLTDMKVIKDSYGNVIRHEYYCYEGYYQAENEALNQRMEEFRQHTNELSVETSSDREEEEDSYYLDREYEEDRPDDYGWQRLP